MRNKTIFFLTSILLIGCVGREGVINKADHPECYGVDRWATSMAFSSLKNEKIINNESLDFSKTKTIRLASEKIDDDLYIQIHYVVFIDKLGNKTEVITKNQASNEECSMSSVDIFVVNKKM